MKQLAARPTWSVFSESLLRAYANADAAFEAVIAHCQLEVASSDRDDWQKEYERLSAIERSMMARLLGVLSSEVKHQ